MEKSKKIIVEEYFLEGFNDKPVASASNAIVLVNGRTEGLHLDRFQLFYDATNANLEGVEFNFELKGGETKLIHIDKGIVGLSGIKKNSSQYSIMPSWTILECPISVPKTSGIILAIKSIPNGATIAARELGLRLRLVKYKDN